MKRTFENPALKRFVADLANEVVMAQILIQRRGTGYELRHVEDRPVKAESLRMESVGGARALAQHTAEGAFRPLKSAPTLQRGWRMELGGDVELESALNQFYPGAIGDWHAAQAPTPPVTQYREFAGRQSGMYRAMALLNDAQVADVIGSTCVKELCLKRRLWAVAGLADDGPTEKSLIPCLEPCAILMESARQKLRTEQRKAGPGAVTACNEQEDS